MDVLAVLRPVAGALVGGAIGFAYYKFVGCRSGVCPLTSNPYIAVTYGMSMGAVLASA